MRQEHFIMPPTCPPGNC